MVDRWLMSDADILQKARRFTTTCTVCNLTKLFFAIGTILVWIIEVQRWSNTLEWLYP